MSAVMDLASFRASLVEAGPPSGLSLPLQALWWDARGDWTRAHDCAQADEGRDASAVHAYLHRKEGDLPNARYWYARARRPIATESLEAEWETQAGALLA